MTISTAGAVSSARAERATSVDLEVGISCFYVTYAGTLVSTTTEEFITKTILQYCEIPRCLRVISIHNYDECYSS